MPRIAALHATGCQHIATWLQQAPYTHAPALDALLGFWPAWLGVEEHLQASARSVLDMLVSNMTSSASMTDVKLKFGSWLLRLGE